MEVMKKFMWVFLAVVCCYVPLVSSQELSHSLKTCKARLKSPGAINQFLAQVGFSMMVNYQYGNGFVFSYPKVLHKFIQLITVGSAEIEKEAKRYMGLPEDDTCDSLYCEAFNSIIDGVNTRQTGYISYASDLYYSHRKSLKSGIFDNCFRDKISIDFSDLEATRNTLGEAYKKFTNKSYDQYLDGNLNPDTDFYMLSGLQVSPLVFKEYQKSISTEQFTDIEGTQKTVEWLKTKGFAYFDQNIEEGITVNLYRDDLIITNGPTQLRMMYFQPIFTTEGTMDKRLFMMKIFKNINQYINDATIMHGGGTLLKSLTVPVIDVKTDADLAVILTSAKEDITKPNEIIYLYTSKSTVYELRTLEYFDNKFRGDNEDLACMQTCATREETINSPFVFALVDVSSSMPLRVGAYF